MIINMSNPQMGGGNVSQSIVTYLKADSWVDNLQTISVNGISLNTNGIVSLPLDCSEENRQIACAAFLKVVSQNDNSITIAAMGEIPQVDLPILIVYSI